MTTWRPAGADAATALDVGSIRVSEAHFAPSLSLGVHEHARNTLAIVLSGGFESLGRVSEECPAGSMVVEPAGDRHACRFGPTGARVLVVQPNLDDDGLSACRPLFSARATLRPRPVALAAARIVRELRAPDVSTPILVEGLLLEIVALGCRSGPCAARKLARPPWLSRTEELLRATFSSALQLRELARQAGVHPVHLQRVFRAHHGVSIGEFQRRLRLEWAAQRLSRSDQSIVDIALDAGFSDHSHLTRAFGRRFGCPPQRYRREHRH